MKLRQKLAAVLAATMVVTAVPVVTMASSDSKLTNAVQYVKEDDGVKNYGFLKIELEDDITTNTMFFVELKGADWAKKPADKKTDDAYDFAQMQAAVDVKIGTGNTSTGTAADVRLARNSDEELQVEINANLFEKDDVIYIPMYTEVTDKEASVSVDGNRTVISNAKDMVFATADTDEATVTFAEKEFINENGSVADITVDEPFPGVIGANSNAKDNQVTFEIEDTDYEFNTTAITGNYAKYIQLTRGYSNFSVGGAGSDIEVSFEEDNTKMVLTFKRVSATSAGRIKAAGLPVKFVEDDEKLDNEIEITVDGNDVNKSTGVVATVKDFGVSTRMKDEKVVEMTAGTKEDITFFIKENIEDSMIEDRTIEVKLENGYFLPREKDDYKDAYNVLKDSSKDSSDIDKDNPFYNVSGLNANDVNVDTLLQNMLNGVKNEEKSSTKFIADGWVWDDDDRAVGFKFKVDRANPLATDKLDDIKFSDVTVYMPLGVSGDIKLSVDGRGVGNAKAETVALKVKAPVTVTAEAATVKVGLKDQKGGKLVIKETDATMLGQNEVIRISIDGWDDGKLDGLRFDDKPEVKVTEGDIELDVEDMTQKSGYIELKVKRDSKKASTIEISNFPIVANRSVPEGSYDLVINGKAVAPDCNLEDIKAEKFILINTPNTEDQGNGGLAKGTTSFVIGANKYVVNGVEKEMDAAAYVSKAGRTMVPVKYLADAFGVDAKNVIFSNGTVTIIAANRTVQIKNNSNVAVVNGVAMTMDEKMVIKNGRSYAPASQIGNILGVTPKWDGATQTASFSN